MTVQANINGMRRRCSKDIAIEGLTARWYDNNTKRYRLTEMKEYAKEAFKHIRNGHCVLEVAPGPGDTFQLRLPS